MGTLKEIAEKGYEPKLVDVMKETGKGAINISKRASVGIIRNIYNYCIKGIFSKRGNFTRGSLETNFIFPTSIRKMGNNPKNDSYEWGFFTGLLYTPLSYIPLFLFNDTSKKVGVYLAATQITTNVLSATYEFFRYKRNKMIAANQKKLQAQTLESVVEKDEK
jgi:hypothetical protein